MALGDGRSGRLDRVARVGRARTRRKEETPYDYDLGTDDNQSEHACHGECLVGHWVVI